MEKIKLPLLKILIKLSLSLYIILPFMDKKESNMVFHITPSLPLDRVELTIDMITLEFAPAVTKGENNLLIIGFFLVLLFFFKFHQCSLFKVF